MITLLKYSQMSATHQVAHHLRYLLPPRNLEITAREVAKALKQFDFDTIVFRGISGALIAPILALRLKKELVNVRKPNDGSHSDYDVEGFRGVKRYVIVDDFVGTGATACAITRAMDSFAPDAVCIGAFQCSRLMDGHGITDGYDPAFITRKYDFRAFVEEK